MAVDFKSQFLFVILHDLDTVAPGPHPPRSLLHRLSLHMTSDIKMATPVSVIFWLHLSTMRGSGDLSSIYIYIYIQSMMHRRPLEGKCSAQQQYVCSLPSWLQGCRVSTINTACFICRRVHFETLLCRGPRVCQTRIPATLISAAGAVQGMSASS